MTEGPGCTNNGRRARAQIRQRVAATTGQLASKIADSIAGWFLAAVWTLGKELWLIFQDSLTSGTRDVAIRVHFGMNGSMLTNGPRPRFSGRELSLCIRFEQGGSLDFFEATVDKETSVAKVRAKCERLHTQDVCADEGVFSANACVAAFASKPKSLVVDAVLDQTILPGAGNIIKVESLHRARVLPTLRVESLSDVAIACIVEHVRAFSLQWLKTGRAPASRVYNKTSCGDCGGSVRMQKLGEGLPRASFWCTRCCACGSSSQPLKNDVRARLTNPVPATHRALDEVNAQRHSHNVEGVIFYGDGTLNESSGKSTAKRKRVTSNDNSVSSQRRLRHSFATPQNSNSPQGGGVAQLLSATAAHPQQPQPGSTAPPAMTNELSGLRNGNTSMASQHSQVVQPALAISCKQHGSRNLALKRVRKQGANNSRLFFSCRAAGCSFFQWADTHFPRCSCPSQPIAALRVSKTENSGGRWFLSCRAGGGNKRCNFFAWASPSQLQPLQGLLNPLT
mmetsp:Transcript_78717/g.149616  ORF Transcript_78717/g.149616 Transcript_78717/m.149616 type:complete len:509 (-) Transcript_78717:60-1586(-)